MSTRLLNIVLFILTFICASLAWVVVTTPSAESLKGCVTTQHYKVSLCNKNLGYVRLNNMSPYFKHLVVIAEDAAFYGHKGFDWSEFKNSLEKNWEALRFARGGSTITQQLAKNVYLDFDKSVVRKLREALIATEIEKILTKNEILEKYLNVIELGPNIYGVGAAARYYFNKSASELNLLESAYLVYLIPNPKVHSQTFKKQKLTSYARYRVLDLIYRMYRYHKISFDQYASAKELVDYFPWQALDSFQIAQLEGQNRPASPEEETVTTIMEHTEIQDSGLESVEPEPEPESEAEPVPILDAAPEPAAEAATPTDQPFDQ